MYTHNVRDLTVYHYMQPVIRPKDRSTTDIFRDINTSIDVFKARLEGFIQADDQKSALDLIDAYAGPLRNADIDPEKLKDSVNDYFGYQSLLKTLDECVNSGRFEEAMCLIDKNTDLIKRMGNDPGSIKGLVKDFKALFKVLEQINAFIKNKNTEKALETADKNRALFEKLEFVFETVREKILSHTPIDLTD